MPGGRGQGGFGRCRALPGISMLWGGHTELRCCPRLSKSEGCSSLRCFRGVGCAQAVLYPWLCWGHLREPPCPTCTDIASILLEKHLEIICFTAKTPVWDGIKEMDLTSQAFCPKFFILDSVEPLAELSGSFPKSSTDPLLLQNTPGAAQGAQPHLPTKEKPFLAAGDGAAMEVGLGILLGVWG